MSLQGKYLTIGQDKLLMIKIGQEITRDSLMFLLLRTYGMRISELLAVKRRDIDLSEGTMKVCGLKKSKSREFPLTEFTRLRLKKYIHGMAEEDRLFPFTKEHAIHIWHGWRVRIQAIGKPLHSLRHTCAIELYKKHKDLLLVKTVLGHRSISSTMVYQEFAGEDDRMKDAFS